MKNSPITGQQKSRFNLLTLPQRQRRVLVYLMREGSTHGATLADALEQAPAALQATLTELTALGAITLTADGHVAVQWGRTRRRALPARLWPALQTASRLYSAQEIVTLRTVVPILQFARARLGEFTDHGPGHVLRVKLFATQLGHISALTATEQHLLRAAALFHDVGNVVERERHHLISQETVEKLAANGQIPFSLSEAALVGLLCRWHRKAYDPTRCDDYHGEIVRTGLLASILRVADALDSDYRRFDYHDKFMWVLEFFYPHQLYIWQGLAEILGIRLCCTPTMHLQVFVQAQTQIEENYHIQALRKDVADTPFDWPVQVIECGSQGVPPNTARETRFDDNAALLICPFEPHSLVMAALSRKHLVAAGYQVELLVYPDTYGATAWLWREALADFNPSQFAHLVIIGDRPDPTIDATVFATLADWRANAVHCTLLNRHEANWARLSASLPLGVQANLGGDWAYFWGDGMDEADFLWGRIAALCTRDPIQSTVGLTAEEQTLSQGLLTAIYRATDQAPDDVDGWSALATPILDAIAADERAWFATQADDFTHAYTPMATPARIEGRVLHFELASKPTTPAIFWGLEAAIEAHGRTAHGICFQRPYAIATWSAAETDPTQADGAIELLAINHWREEEATPIRLLYPLDLSPVPEGNESALRVRLPAGQAMQVVQALIAACNQA